MNVIFSNGMILMEYLMGMLENIKKTIKIMYIIRDVVFVHLTLKSKPELSSLEGVSSTLALCRLSQMMSISPVFLSWKNIYRN